jgi:predicted nucleotidyltransferase
VEEKEEKPDTGSISAGTPDVFHLGESNPENGLKYQGHEPDKAGKPVKRMNGKTRDTELTEKVRETILGVLKPQGVARVSVFGSYARGEAGPNGDIDILVRFENPKSLFELVHIQNELEQALGHKVDLVTEGAGSPYLIDTIRQEEVVILE